MTSTSRDITPLHALDLAADHNGNSELREYANVNCNGLPMGCRGRPEDCPCHSPSVPHRNSRMTEYGETRDGYLVPITPGSIYQPPSTRYV